MDLLLLKGILVLVMIGATLLVGMLPVRLLKLLRKKAAHAQSTRNRRYVSLALCLLTCFSGGVFLATCFLHLLPELMEHVDLMRRTYKYEWDYPVAELLSCAGFFLLFFIEELVIIAVPSLAHGHSHGGHGHAHGDGHAHGSTLTDVSVECHQHDHGGHHECRLLSHSDDDEKSAPPTDGTVTASVSDGLLPVSGTLDSTAPITRNGHAQNGHCGRKQRCNRSMALAEPERCETNCDQIKEHPPILMESRPHAHSHGIRSVTFVLAISFHSIVEGLALGVQHDAAKVTAIFFSLMVHKLIVAFSVGLQLARTHAHALRWVCLSIVVFSLMTPLGALIGMFVHNAQIDTHLRDVLILIFQGIAVGTFLYVTFFEVLIHERDNEHPNLVKLLLMIIGFALIGMLRLVAEGHSHGGSDEPHGHAHFHGHGHSHDHDH